MRLAALGLAIALSAACGWLPAAAQVMGSFNPGTDTKLPNGGRPENHVAFPEIKDWSSLKITLMRSMCYGTCPSYVVTIAGDGTVTWEGQRFVKVAGTRTVKIAPEKVHALFEAFRKAEFFWLLDDYNAAITDFPVQVTTISFDGNKKSVRDYAGGMVGMPQVVGELERAIDDAANTAQWIGPPDDPARQMH